MTRPEFVNPFVQSLQNVLVTMTGIEAAPKVAGEPLNCHVAGIIGITGNRTRGSLAVTFSRPCFLAVASKMLGEPIDQLDDEIAEMAGEIVNMTMGGAKIPLEELGYHFELAVPSHVWGERVYVRHAAELSAHVVNLETPHGPLALELCVVTD